MKKILFVILALFAVSAMAADVKGDQGRNKQLGKRFSYGSEWSNHTPDPAFNWAIKAQRQRCPIIDNGACVVLETYFLNGHEDSDICNVTQVAIANEVNVYPNALSATRVLNRCSHAQQFQTTQYISDFNHDGVNEVSQFLSWEFSLVRQDK